MKTIAAILIETGQPLQLEEIEIPALRPGQVLVEIGYAGVCHTQLLEVRGLRGTDRFLPHCLGHEGSGRVIDTGSAISKVSEGDEVVLSWIKGSGAEEPGTRYGSSLGEVNSGAITTFSQHAVISENRVTPIRENLSLRNAAFLGCALPTGIGAVVNTANVRPGQSVVVIGTGGVGCSAIMGAALAGAHPIAAVDLIPSKLEVARRCHATHTLCDDGNINVAERLNEICPGGFDVAIEASGAPEAMALALQTVRPRGGTAVLIGNASHGSRVSIDPSQFNLGKRLLGTWGGDCVPDRDIPRLSALVSSGHLNVDALGDDRFTLEDVNKALDALATGCALRPILQMSEA